MVQREHAAYSSTAFSLPKDIENMGLQTPTRVQHSLQANMGLVKRLSHTQTFKGHSSAVNALDWSSDGEVLLSGGDDCRVKLWSVERGKAMQSFDSGHTSSIYVTKFMPNTGNEQIITSAADRQVRLVNLHRSAIKPYTFHHGRVRALVPLDPFMFMSGSDDGTVRHYDTREPASANSIPGMRTGDVLADQRRERTPRGKISINAVAVDPMRPHLFVTGSNDPLVRLYDRRMSGQRGLTQSPSGGSWPQWVSCFIPTALNVDSMQPRSSNERAPFLTSVKFSAGGDQVFASYNGDNIYSFDSVDHARNSTGYCSAHGWSRPNSAFGTRSASRHAVLHAPASGTAISDGHAAGQASDQGTPAETQRQQATTATQTDDVGQPASSNVHDVSVGPSATGGEGTAGRPSSSGRLTSAAAAAVAHIRRRRAAAARTQDSPHLHAPPSASAGTETAGLAGPDVADSLQPHGSNVERHVQSCQPTAPTPVADPRADARAEDPRAEGLHAGAAAQSQQHQQPAESSGRSADAAEQALPGEREGLPVSTHELSMERESLPVTRHGPPPERQPSAPRPPLPFHPIRRSARLHKSGGNAASGPASSADNGNLDASHSAAADAAGVTADTFVAADSTHADANAASEPLGPCTRHSCKRKLAELSDSAAPASEHAAPHRRHDHLASSAQPPPVAAAAAQQAQHTQRHMVGTSAAEPTAPVTAEPGTSDCRTNAAPTMHHVGQQPGDCGAHGAQEPAGRNQSVAARSLRHCRSLRSAANEADVQQQPEQSQYGSVRDHIAQRAQQPAQHAQRDADSLNAQQVEACVASSRRLEQPTASTGTSRPVPLLHIGTSMQASQAGEGLPWGPPDFLRLQYSTDPPTSAHNSRESTPDQAAEVTQPRQQALQVQGQAGGTSSEFPRPTRHARRARGSRLAPLPATSAAHGPHAASATLPPLDPPDIVSGQTDNAAAHSQACSRQECGGGAVSVSADARGCSCSGMDDAEPDADVEPAGQQPREGTPVSSNRCHYRARGRASVEASNAPRAPSWHPSSMLATAEPSCGNSPRGSYNHSTQPGCAEHQAQEAEVAGPAEEEVLSPHQSRQIHADLSAQPAMAQSPVGSSQDGNQAPASSSVQTALAAIGGNLQEGIDGGSALPEALSPSGLGGGTAIHATAAEQRQQMGSPQDQSRAALMPWPQEHAVPCVRRRQRSSMLRRSTSHTAQPPTSSSPAHTQPATAVENRHQGVSTAPRGLSRSLAHGPARAATDGPVRAVGGSPEADSAPGPSTSAEGPERDASREGQLQRHGSRDAQLAGVVDSFVGAIMSEDSDEDGQGEVVEERGMFQQRYRGHCNLTLNKEICLLGSRDEFVVSGSDDGRVFIWDQGSGRLVNMLSSDDRNVSCVAAHPSMPMLASAGSEPVVKLWSPQAEFACNLDRAEAIMLQNAQELAEGDRRSNLAGPPPMWLNMLGTAVSAELRAPGETVPARNANPIRCTIM